MGQTLKILPNYTYDEYAQWEGRWELIDGVPYAMSPLPIPRHQIVSGNLHYEFTKQLKKCKKCRALQPLDYKIDESTVLEPDMLVVCGEIKKKYLDFPPALVVEVLSPSTALKDRHTKFSIYETEGVPYYLIVDADKKVVEIYQLENKQYLLAQQGSHFSYHFKIEDCEAVIDFGEIWA